MALKSVLRGWKCDCGINRNTTNEVLKDCVCKKHHTRSEVDKSNEIYWENFWNR